MVPSAYLPFFTTRAAAGGALIGLLFVAVSLAPEHIVTRDAPVERQAIAVSTFMALVNAFFMSLLALVPTVNLGLSAVLAGLAALFNTGVVARRLMLPWQRWTSLLRRSVLILVSCLVYGLQVYEGIVLMRDGHYTAAVTSLAFPVIGMYAIGLQRAWQLLGARSAGVLSWFNLLRDLPEPGDGERQRHESRETVHGSDAPRTGDAARHEP